MAGYISAVAVASRITESLRYTKYATRASQKTARLPRIKIRIKVIFYRTFSGSIAAFLFFPSPYNKHCGVNPTLILSFLLPIFVFWLPIIILWLLHVAFQAYAVNCVLLPYLHFIYGCEISWNLSYNERCLSMIKFDVSCITGGHVLRSSRKLPIPR